MQMKYNSYVSKTANLHCCKSSRDQKLYSGNRSCMWHKAAYRTRKKINYPRIQRSKRLMHWFHFNSVCDILHVRIVKKFLLHSAADFLGKRKVSIFSSFLFLDSVAFFIGKIELETPIEWVVLATDRDFETQKVCHSNKQKTLPPLPPNRFFLTALILGGHVTSRNRNLLPTTKWGRGERPWERGWRKANVIITTRHETVNYDALSMTR